MSSDFGESNDYPTQIFVKIVKFGKNRNIKCEVLRGGMIIRLKISNQNLKIQSLLFELVEKFSKMSNNNYVDNLF